MCICQNSERVHPYLLKCCGDTCSFVGMLKGYIVRKRLGTPDLVEEPHKICRRLAIRPPLVWTCVPYRYQQSLSRCITCQDVCIQ